MKKQSPHIIIIGVVLCLFPLMACAQVDITGFVRNYNAALTRPDYDIITGRNRLRLNLDHAINNGKIHVSNDITNRYDLKADSISYRLREAYVDLYFSKIDLRLGKQIVSWGRTEGTFISDILTPVDLSSFLTQDFSDLRMGITAIKLTRYFGSNYAQLVVNPVFNSDKLPDYNSRWFPTLPFSTTLPITITPNQKDPSLKNTQIAARYAWRSNLNFDLDLALMYWNYPQPTYAKTIDLGLPNGAQLNLKEQYQQSFIGTYSGTLELTDNLLLKSESAYYQKRLFDYLSPQVRGSNLQDPGLSDLLQIGQAFVQNSDSFIKERPWLVTMAGLQYSLGKFTLNGQFINEHIFNYDDTILQLQDYYYATFSLRRSFLRDKFRFSFFSRYNFPGQDFWLNPEVTFAGIDSFEATLGSQLFGGEPVGDFYGHLSFKSYDANSFAYLKITAFF